MIEIKHKLTGKVLYTVKADSLRRANLRDANLRGADLRYANLSNADLSNANLRDADLRYADLRYADLRYADLRYADLSGATSPPMQINALHWPILIHDGNIRIGCEKHTVDKWEKFTDDEINEMDTDALKFWKQYGAVILLLAKSHEG